jgi:hypothetical protein
LWAREQAWVVAGWGGGEGVGGQVREQVWAVRASCGVVIVSVREGVGVGSRARCGWSGEGGSGHGW